MKRPAALMLLLAPSLPASAADPPNSDSDGQNEADKPTLIERVKSKLSPKSDEAAAVLKQKYPVRIEAQPADVKEMLQEHLPLITQQLEEELDAEQMEFLAEEAPEQVLTMLKTKGYFNGKVTVSRKGMGYLVGRCIARRKFGRVLPFGDGKLEPAGGRDIQPRRMERQQKFGFVGSTAEKIPAGRVFLHPSHGRPDQTSGRLVGIGGQRAADLLRRI